ncbi:unnamed protein product [Arabidopsis thaliana]|uniref:Uncharacterized protein n=2 Tax=Arabidopsis TaxID=3701 RepID=A0A654GDF3_ARATH|nr:hypothetical protein ISN44_As05g057970 [Arabidopsis suecica]VYS71193.1 unnamed protein product [Arabidopsis thaliana]
MEKMVLRKVVLLALLLSLSCLWVAKALEGESKVSGQVRDETPHTWYCKYDDNCRENCPGCTITKCNYGVCICSNCYHQQSDLGVESHM